VQKDYSGSALLRFAVSWTGEGALLQRSTQDWPRGSTAFTALRSSSLRCSHNCFVRSQRAIAGATNSAPNSAASALTISNPLSVSTTERLGAWSYQQQAFMQGTNWVQALSQPVPSDRGDGRFSDLGWLLRDSERHRDDAVSGLKPAVPLPRAIQFRHSPRPTVPFKHLGITHPSRAAWPA